MIIYDSDWNPHNDIQVSLNENTHCGVILRKSRNEIIRVKACETSPLEICKIRVVRMGRDGK